MRSYDPPLPIRARVAADGSPHSFVLDGVTYVVETIEEVRAPDLDWWTATPAKRMYFLVTTTRAKVAELVDLEPVPTMNALRHTYASLLVDGGLPPHIVAKLLGHADVRLTVNTYYHATPIARQAAVDALGVALKTMTPFLRGA